MKFAIPFDRKFKYFDVTKQELNIIYKPNLKKLNDFLEAYGAFRINLIMENFNKDKDIEYFHILTEKFPQTELVMALPEYNPEIEQEMNEADIPHYYSSILFDWDRFNGFLGLNVTDVVVGYDLMFSAPVIKEKAAAAGKRVRAYCNVCQRTWDTADALTSFFVRPDDIFRYEEYVDTFEILRHWEGQNLNILYEIYAKDEKWLGKLSEIIIDYDGDENNRFFLPVFGEHRISCGKQCNKTIKRQCHICNSYGELSRTLEKHGLMVKRLDKN